MLRQLRRRADVSQRDLAVRSGVPQATIARIESGATPNPSFRQVETLVRAAGARVHVDAQGCEIAAGPTPPTAVRDRAGRRYPAHLDIREVRGPGDWWGSCSICCPVVDLQPWGELPAVTFDRNRAVRDERRGGGCSPPCGPRLPGRC
jgi:transcriptional regulator with XRE-family HTH domain